MSSPIPYVQPFSPHDPPSADLIILFLEAVARVTPAFADLRDSIPLHALTAPVDDEIDIWMSKWHLDFENYELRERIQTWIFNVLDLWQRDSQARESLSVTCGWWNPDPLIKKGSDKPPARVLLGQWNPEREGFEAYASRARSSFEKFLQEQKRNGEAELEKWEMQPYRKRESGRPPEWDYEFLALSICCGMSDGQIAIRPGYKGVSRDVVKKARQALQKHLHISSGK